MVVDSFFHHIYDILTEHRPHQSVELFLEVHMNAQRNDAEKSTQSADDGILEKIARAIDPPSREVSDEELIDPGANTPDSNPKGNKPKPADAK